MGNAAISTAAGGQIPASLRKTWTEARMMPLWESPLEEIARRAREPAHIWRWSTIYPILMETSKISDPAIVERRVMSLLSANSRSLDEDMTTGVMNATYQTLLPGERARPHRHSMNALRFILDGAGAESVVDGKVCAMEPGDLVLTPAWTWHEHVHRGSRPAFWVDILDVHMHRVLGTESFEPGPAHDVPQGYDDKIFTSANVVPVLPREWERNYSPVFRYPWIEVVKALAAAPPAHDGSKTIRYTNPVSGGPCLALLDCFAIDLDPCSETIAFKSSASAVCTIVEGEGVSSVGDKKLDWKPRDIFTIPQNNWVTHKAVGGRSKIFVATNRPLYSRLGLLKEESKS